jgi:hypothetical protein
MVLYKKNNGWDDDIFNLKLKNKEYKFMLNLLA